MIKIREAGTLATPKKVLYVVTKRFILGVSWKLALLALRFQYPSLHCTPGDPLNATAQFRSFFGKSHQFR